MNGQPAESKSTLQSALALQRQLLRASGPRRDWISRRRRRGEAAHGARPRAARTGVLQIDGARARIARSTRGTAGCSSVRIQWTALRPRAAGRSARREAGCCRGEVYRESLVDPAQTGAHLPAGAGPATRISAQLRVCDAQTGLAASRERLRTDEVVSVADQ